MITGQRFDVPPQKIFNLEDYPKLTREQGMNSTFILNLLLNFIKDLKEEIISVDRLNLNYLRLSDIKSILFNICTEEERLDLEKFDREDRRKKYSYMTELCLKYYEELKQEFKRGNFRGVDIRYVRYI